MTFHHCTPFGRGPRIGSLLEGRKGWGRWDVEFSRVYAHTCETHYRCTGVFVDGSRLRVRISICIVSALGGSFLTSGLFLRTSGTFM